MLHFSVFFPKMRVFAEHKESFLFFFLSQNKLVSLFQSRNKLAFRVTQRQTMHARAPKNDFFVMEINFFVNGHVCMSSVANLLVPSAVFLCQRTSKARSFAKATTQTACDQIHRRNSFHTQICFSFPFEHACLCLNK